MIERFALIEATRKLAKERGLDPRDVYCSEGSSCVGTYCPRINLGEITPIVGLPSRIEVFNARQEKTRKLQGKVVI